MRALSSDFRLIRYDARGNGLSDWKIDDFSYEALVRDLESAVDAAGLDRFPLLGISQGCAVAIGYAMRHPERVMRMVLHGGYAKGWRTRGNPSEIAKREAMLTLVLEGWARTIPRSARSSPHLILDHEPVWPRFIEEIGAFLHEDGNAARHRSA